MNGTTSTTLEPPAGLVVDNPQPGSPPLFALFTTDWLSMQTFVVQALQLPFTQGDFESKYGNNFKDEQEALACIAAMKKVRDLSVVFGDPTTLMADLAANPAILQTPTAPTEVYTHIVWFATRLYQSANTYQQTLAQFEQLLDPASCGSKAQCGALLTQVLTGPGGLQSTAVTMVGLCNDLVAAMAGFAGQLTPATNEFQSYTSETSKFYTDVCALITQDDTDVQTAKDAAHAAYEAWKDYTIAAVSSSVGLLIVTGGMAWPASVVLAGVLGDKAKKARDAYNDACDQVAKYEAVEVKNIQLKVDLQGFNTQMTPVNTAAANFVKTLQQVTGVWTTTASNLDFIVTHFTPEQLGDLGWVMQAMALDRATKDWKAIATVAQAYTANSLVSYNIGTFGQKVPDPS